MNKIILAAALALTVAAPAFAETDANYYLGGTHERPMVRQSGSFSGRAPAYTVDRSAEQVQIDRQISPSHR